jgi:hypothetical protein
MGKNRKGEGKLDFIFPDYRIWEDVPFGFWYVGFFAMTLAFFNLSINFFSHLALLLGWLTDTVREFPREPGALDLILSGVFALYYLVCAPLLFYLACLYWNFREVAKKRLKLLFVIDAAVFLIYNIANLSGLYLYGNPYFKLKAPIYIILVIVALYFVSTSVEEDTKAVLKRAGEKAGA